MSLNRRTQSALDVSIIRVGRCSARHDSAPESTRFYVPSTSIFMRLGGSIPAAIGPSAVAVRQVTVSFKEYADRILRFLSNRDTDISDPPAPLARSRRNDASPTLSDRARFLASQSASSLFRIVLSSKAKFTGSGSNIRTFWTEG